jgi:hypothetical protein
MPIACLRVSRSLLSSTQSGLAWLLLPARSTPLSLRHPVSLTVCFSRPVPASFCSSTTTTFVRRQSPLTLNNLTDSGTFGLRPFNPTLCAQHLNVREHTQKLSLTLCMHPNSRPGGLWGRWETPSRHDVKQPSRNDVKHCRERVGWTKLYPTHVDPERVSLVISPVALFPPHLTTVVMPVQCIVQSQGSVNPHTVPRGLRPPHSVSHVFPEFFISPVRTLTTFIVRFSGSHSQKPYMICHHVGPTPDCKVQPEVAPQRDHHTRPPRYPVDPPLPRNKHSRKRRGFRFGRWVRNKYCTKSSKNPFDSLVSFVSNPRLTVVFKIIKRLLVAIGLPKTLPLPSHTICCVSWSHPFAWQRLFQQQRWRWPPQIYIRLVKDHPRSSQV